MNAKILFIDIETAPATSHHWGMYDQNIAPNQLVHDWYLICYVAKWLGKKKCTSDALWRHKRFKREPRNDIEVARSAHRLLDDANIVVAHNGDDFDVKRLNTRFLAHKLGPTAPFLTVDTKKVAKKYFGFLSNKLDFILRTMSMGSKMSHCGFSMWIGAMAGNPRACREMLKYNRVDTLKLEEVYLLMRPYMKDHPDLNIYDGDFSRMLCPNCGSMRTQRRGKCYTKLKAYPRRACIDCGAWFKAKDN